MSRVWVPAEGPLLSEDGNEIITEGQNPQEIIVRTLVIGTTDNLVFPIPTFPLVVEHYKPRLKIGEDSEVIHIRPRAFRMRRKFTLTWKMLPQSEYQLIMEIFERNIGKAFYWVNPVDGKTYYVTFSDAILESYFESYNRWNASLTLEEI